MSRGLETREINRGASLSAATSSLAGATGANAVAPQLSRFWRNQKKTKKVTVKDKQLRCFFWPPFLSTKLHLDVQRAQAPQCELEHSLWNQEETSRWVKVMEWLHYRK